MYCLRPIGWASRTMLVHPLSTICSLIQMIVGRICKLYTCSQIDPNGCPRSTPQGVWDPMILLSYDSLCPSLTELLYHNDMFQRYKRSNGVCPSRRFLPTVELVRISPSEQSIRAHPFRQFYDGWNTHACRSSYRLREFSQTMASSAIASASPPATRQ